ncbi:MAG: type II toxin-antitoxin system mRNA interferase toxin, RelE/StbE family [Crocosphaera sp.]|nr:type II toxin-antitoxin system mRNA interferase toxin, RelE/StbE family [Crocosphaera watsonii]MCH2243572.1 type II toxin-antitoxin system mRNA interferase toxin, RelE/StbE family [Crocosphaera sp.]
MLGNLNHCELLKERMIRKNPAFRPLIEKTVRQLAEDPFHPSLRTHKLKGDLSNVWSCSIDYSNRVLFEFIEDPEQQKQAILLLNLGSHDEVY